VPPQRVRGELDGEALGDASQIYLDAGSCEMDRMPLAIDEQIPITHERPHAGQLRVRRLVRLPVVKAPQTHEWAHRDVERAAAAFADSLRGVEHAEHRIADGDVVMGRVAVDAR
jgi:hypothetical protein